ncbi:hypothetical protein Acr_22g0005500 [Actinidia rufa]|uniref:Uncharacterized protein n=1 Tax=Actinidia rufa TaxID=165716 RepID=A0A7J0GK60_9ERIC|nr:hypothetical protein Acr_22g0005500 [Actinidia rufa]
MWREEESIGSYYSDDKGRVVAMVVMAEDSTKKENERRLSAVRGVRWVVRDGLWLGKIGYPVSGLYPFGPGRSSCSQWSRTSILKLVGIPLKDEFTALVDKAGELYLQGLVGLKKVLHDRAGG